MINDYTIINIPVIKGDEGDVDCCWELQPNVFFQVGAMGVAANTDRGVLNIFDTRSGSLPPWRSRNVHTYILYNKIYYLYVYII